MESGAVGGTRGQRPTGARGGRREKNPRDATGRRAADDDGLAMVRAHAARLEGDTATSPAFGARWHRGWVAPPTLQRGRTGRSITRARSVTTSTAPRATVMRSPPRSKPT